ncbi:hypothetical protein [Ancylobacter lacus]|uniref:hypothetical protein n=1 Tax=Ancylobacter lacus TaxID=2579970 RepID=UPI001BCD0D9D|nr:hypothetical protein [Ancylobacter lacus]MBS7537328.1 hypothetical protein [Ancylobacter lacus]
MPIHHSLWRVASKPEPLREASLPSEALLEDMIVASPDILSREWMIIGRQEDTGFGGRIDLLALAPDIATMMDGFEDRLTPEQQADPRYAFRVYMVGRTANRAPSADLAVEIVPSGSAVEEKFNIALKEVEKKKYLPSDIVNQMKAEGWDKFTMDCHTKLWKKLDAKNPAKGYGSIAVGKTWCWYDNWLNRVREECQQHPARYRTAPAEAPLLTGSQLSDLGVA